MKPLNRNHIITALLLCLSVTNIFSQGVPLPYYTGFDNASQKLGWQQFRTGYLSTYSWSYGGGGFSPTYCISHDYNVGATSSSQTVIDWFVSPPLNFTTTGKISLKVKTGGFSTPFPDNCEVYFGTDKKDPSTGNFVLVANLSYMVPQYQWLDTTIDLPFVTDSGYIAIKYKTIGAAWMTYAIDNINITLDSGVSIKEEYSKNRSTSYPNPFSSTTMIVFPNSLLNAELMIYSIDGQKVKSITNISGDHLSIERNDLRSGVYFYKVVEEGAVKFSGKFVVVD
jgi:hypothetical protein